MLVQVRVVRTPGGGRNTTKEGSASRQGLFCLQKRRATGIIFKHINSQWQEGGELFSVSTADRIKHNELKLQQEKVREDIRINFLGEQERLCPVSITAGRQGQLRQTYSMCGRSAGGWTWQ